MGRDRGREGKARAWAGVGWPGLGPAQELGALGLLTLVHVAAGLPAADEGLEAAAGLRAARRPGSRDTGWAGGARSSLPAPSPRAALRGTALRARERRVRPAAAPCAGSADAERGRLHYPPEDAAAAAPSLCIPRLVRCGVSLAADCHSVTCGRRRDLSKNLRPLPAQIPGKGPSCPMIYSLPRKERIIEW